MLHDILYGSLKNDFSTRCSGRPNILWVFCLLDCLTFRTTSCGYVEHLTKSTYGNAFEGHQKLEAFIFPHFVHNDLLVNGCGIIKQLKLDLDGLLISRRRRGRLAQMTFPPVICAMLKFSFVFVCTIHTVLLLVKRMRHLDMAQNMYGILSTSRSLLSSLPS